uniref:Band 3 cytoplasmic domain-containing protein n=1 Tax=Romanomermis culicivorax TaxID=13658 RepID=A0A915KQ15_ROMCU
MESSMNLSIDLRQQSIIRRTSVMVPEEDDVIMEALLHPQVLHIGHYDNGKSSVDRVKQILESDEDDASFHPRPIFCEMLYFDADVDDPNAECWKESSRWIKFEETVEEAGTRWSKPHVTLLTIRHLLQIKNSLTKGLTLFDVSVQNFAELV